MTRLVHDRDGRGWSVGARAHLVGPDANRVAVEPADAALRVVLLVVSALLVFVVVLSTPATLWLPGLVVGPVLLVATTSTVLWVLSRPWSVTAASATVDPDPDEDEVEVRWVRGPWAAHREVVALSAELAAWTTAAERDPAGDLPFRG